MLDVLIRAALAECAEQLRFPAKTGMDVIAWMTLKCEDGL